MKPVCNSAPDGVHYLMEFFGCDTRQLDSVGFWRKLLTEAISAADVAILHRRFYKFSPHGVTGYLLLSASHISVHTWPEYAYAACDVFSCGDESKASTIAMHIRKRVAHNKTTTKKVKRGFKVTQQ